MYVYKNEWTIFVNLGYYLGGFPSQSPISTILTYLINACTALAILNAVMIVEPSVNFYFQQYLRLYGK